MLLKHLFFFLFNAPLKNWLTSCAAHSLSPAYLFTISNVQVVWGRLGLRALNFSVDNSPWNSEIEPQDLHFLSLRAKTKKKTACMFVRCQSKFDFLKWCQDFREYKKTFWIWIPSEQVLMRLWRRLYKWRGQQIHLIVLLATAKYLRDWKWLLNWSTLLCGY